MILLHIVDRNNFTTMPACYYIARVLEHEEEELSSLSVPGGSVRFALAINCNESQQ